MQAVVDNNLVLVRLLHIHGADINRWDSVDIFLARYLQYLHREDSDTWSPLHAAAANGHHEIVSYLLAHGADRHKVTEDGERAEDLVEDEDWATLAVFADTEEQLEQEKLRRLSAVAVVEGRGQEARREPAWVRRMSLQEARKEVGGAGAGQEKETADTRRKGSAWVGKEEIVEEEESDDTPDQEEVVVPPAKPPRVAAPPASVPPRSLATTTIIVSKERDTEARSQPRQRRRGRLEGEGVGSQFLSVSADKVKTPPSRPSTLASKPSPTSTSASKPSTPSISVSTPSSTSSLTPVTSGAVAAAKQRFIVAASAGTETVAVKVSENVSSSSSSSVTAASASSSTSSSSSAKFGKIKFSETSDKISTTACVTGTTKER